MILVHNYILGIICCIYCCLCWGSWANTQKMVSQKNWRFELFYIDLTIGLFLAALLGAVTLGSMGGGERTFFTDLAGLDYNSIGYAVLGGIIWNFANVFLTAAIAIAGMSVGFPIGGGLGWIGGIIFNYILVVAAGNVYPGNQVLLWTGVIIASIAIYICAKAYGRISTAKATTPKKGVLLALMSGVGFMFFYGLVVKSVSPDFVSGGTGSLTPYTAVFFFSIGILITTPIFNTFAMKHPVSGDKVMMREYLNGDMRTHVIGILGGLIWMSGMVVSFMGSGSANPAISYALSNASPVVAMIWGFFVWKEFKGAPKGVTAMITTMFILFVLALVLITLSN
jgi:glucose uptake protein